MSHRSSVLVAAAASLLAAAGHTPPARACGGFFCSQVPIDQSGEQIVFSIDDQGVTAHIQIQFQGNAKDFAWVVPVMAKPKIDLGTQALFTTLIQRTQPQFMIDWQSGGSCRFAPNDLARGGLPSAAAPPSAEGGVSVLEQKEVGPYDTVVLESRDAMELVKWLDTNGYQQPESAFKLIEHYVNNGFLFLALKLKQDAGTGEIQPLVLQMPHSEACVPLILTRVAAVPDMPVRVFTLGKHRAAASNWFQVEINQKKVDWLAGGQNYRQVVTNAINEAGGHGFVTEFAGKSDFLKNTVYQDGRFNLETLRPLTDPVQFVQALFRMAFPRGDQTLLALLRKHIPMPAHLRERGLTDQQFYNGIGQYQRDLAGVRVDTAAFIADLEERMVAPMRKAQAMLDAQPYLTRLYSTVSPDEMTRDPLFHFNASLPSVSNVHRAKGYQHCSADGRSIYTTLVLENGESIFLPDGTGGRPWNVAGNEPSASRIELVGPSGAPTRYSGGQARVVDKMLDTDAPELVRSRTIVDPEGTSSDSGFFGCSMLTRGGSEGVPLFVTLAVLVLARGRRKR